MPRNESVYDLIYDEQQVIEGLKLITENATKDLEKNQPKRRDLKNISFLLELGKLLN